MNGSRLIDIENVKVVRNGRLILNNIDFKVNRGDMVAVTGPNGGGKTTLLRVMLKLIKPECGSVRYYDGDGSVCNRLSIGYLPQKNAIDSQFPITVREVVKQGMLAYKSLSGAEVERRVDEMVENVGLTSHAGYGLSQLSGGQLQRALLARALVSRPEVLVLDEPLSYLDKRFEERMLDIIREVAEKSTVIVVSHEITQIAAMANRHLVVDRELHVCHSHSHFVHYDCEAQAELQVPKENKRE